MARTKFLEIILSPWPWKKNLGTSWKGSCTLMTPNQSWIPWPRCLAWYTVYPTARRDNGGLHGNVIVKSMGDFPANISKPWLMTGGSIVSDLGIFCLEPSPEIAKDWIVQFFAVPVRLARTLASSVCLNIGLRVLDTGSKQRGFRSVFSVRPRRNWKKPLCRTFWVWNTTELIEGCRENLQERSVFRERSGDNLDLDDDLT